MLLVPCSEAYWQGWVIRCGELAWALWASSIPGLPHLDARDTPNLGQITLSQALPGIPAENLFSLSPGPLPRGSVLVDPGHSRQCCMLPSLPTAFVRRTSFMISWGRVNGSVFSECRWDDSVGSRLDLASSLPSLNLQPVCQPASS